MTIQKARVVQIFSFILLLTTLHVVEVSAAPPCGTPKGGPCVDNAPPIANITGPSTVSIDEPIVLDGGSSYDPEGEPITYSWTDGPETPLASFSKSTAGTYTFSLTVSDGVNSVIASHTVVVGGGGPVSLAPKCGLDEDPPLGVSARVDDCMAKMNLDDKIGQMAMGDHLELKSDDHVISFKLGALLAGGGHAPASGNMPDDWARMVDRFQQDALSTDLGIPLLFGIDAIHGHNNVFGATIFPHNIGLGATRNPNLACEIGKITAKEVAATGINWTFSPTLCVTRDERWGRAYECFGEVPEIPTMMTSIIGGYQGTGLCTTGSGLGAIDSILATAKHWVGDGGTVGGVDQGDTPYDELVPIHMPPYYPAIVDQNVGSVMISYNSINGEKMHANPFDLIDGDLRYGSLDFDGIVLSDWAAISGLASPGGFSGVIETAIKGGIDMAMEPYNYDTFVRNLIELVEAGAVAETRIDDAVRRILEAKVNLGLFNPPYGRLFTDAAQTMPTEQYNLINSIGSPAHRDVARQAVRESLVLLKNSQNLLPVTSNNIGDSNYKIVVAGKSADDIGIQSGGWTISWQGSKGDITLGDTVYDGVAAHFQSMNNVQIVLNESPRSNVSGDLGIVVVGETPYAEGKGDATSLALGRKDKGAINAVCGNMPCVVVLISGRPMIITDQNADDNVDAIVAAWLPGSEGRGIADVLFGGLDASSGDTYSFTGKLPVSWPVSMSQIPINAGDIPYAPLFEIGYSAESQ